jgi:hypothetical protein
MIQDHWGSGLFRLDEVMPLNNLNALQYFDKIMIIQGINMRIMEGRE